jgi:hypothetical protein|tara:strand:+ start:1444 stop:2094 length:651 start_codon:yes stop_codon:yes gene_type:complete
MAVSTHTQAATSGNEDIDGGVIMNGGTIASSRHTSKSILDIIAGADDYGSMVKANTGTAHETGITTARSDGSLAYNPNGRAITRSSSNTGFLIRGGSPTLISGIASTGGILSIPGSDTTARKAGNLHFTESVRQKGTWATAIFDLFGGGLLQSDGSAKSGITNRGTKYINNSIDNAKADTPDDAARPTRSVPGEMVLLFNFVSYSTNMVDYSDITG